MHGHRDPFAWLEDDSARTAEWTRLADSAAVDRLRSSPRYAVVAEELQQCVPPPALTPRHAGGRWFRVDLSGGTPLLVTAATITGAATALFDPRITADTDGGIILSWTPSPTGKFVAVALAQTLSSPPIVRVVDVERQVLLADRAPTNNGPLSGNLLAWLPDDSGFYYVGGFVAGTRWGPKRLVFHPIGGDLIVQSEVVDTLDAEAQVSADGRYVAVLTDTVSAPRPSWLLDREAGHGWRSFLHDVRGRCRGVFVGDRYVAVTTEAAPRGQLVSIPVEHAADRSTWRLLRPEPPGDAVMWSVTLAGDDLLVTDIDDSTASFHVLAPDGRLRRTIGTPGPGAVGAVGPARMPGSDTAFATPGAIVFTHQSHRESAAVFRADLADGSITQLSPRVRADRLVSRRVWSTAADGTRLPLHVVHRTDLDVSTPRPTILTAYGGFGVADLPTYPAGFMPFIDAGGVFAWATIRGGGERGDDWWAGGRLANKGVHFDDFCAAAAQLVDSGMTSPRHLAVWGASNGGLLAAAAAVRRPDLFRAVVALIPFADLLRYDKDPIARGWLVRDWGDPNNPEHLAFLRDHSPYHNIEDGVTYPAMLIVYGDRDDMAPGWHARKLAARLLSSAGPSDVLLRCWAGFGHLEAAMAPPAHAAEWLAFLMDEVGL